MILSASLLDFVKLIALGASADKSADIVASELAPPLLALVMQANPGLVLDVHALRVEIASVVEALRHRPDILSAQNAEFDPKWLDSVDRSTWKHWPALKKFLLDHRVPPRSAAGTASLETSSDAVLRMVGPANIISSRRGLVLGYVQSGKTENFTSLTAKAADVGFKLIIVLSGIDDEIRRQTQLRFDQGVFGVGSEFSADGVPFPFPPWNKLTNAQNDLIVLQGADAYLSTGSAGSVTAVTAMVVKKNKAILERLKGWLAAANVDVLSALPVLVIDDEADQASLTNASSVDDPTEINRLIREILGLCANSRYVAYTATPFANFFVNSNQLTGAHGNDLYLRSLFCRYLRLLVISVRRIFMVYPQAFCATGKNVCQRVFAEMLRTLLKTEQAHLVRHLGCVGQSCPIFSAHLH